jgi:hypothetical protein
MIKEVIWLQKIDRETEVQSHCHCNTCSTLESNQFPHRCIVENPLTFQQRVCIIALSILNRKIYSTRKHVECAFSKCYLKFKVLLLVIRVVLGFMLVNMYAHMCLIRKGSCSGRREAHAYIERNWTTGAALFRMCTACKGPFNSYKGFKYKWFMLQN